MKYDFTHFTDELSKIKCTLNNSQLEQFELYYDMLIEKNKLRNFIKFQLGVGDVDESVVDTELYHSCYWLAVKVRCAALLDKERTFGLPFHLLAVSALEVG